MLRTRMFYPQNSKYKNSNPYCQQTMDDVLSFLPGIYHTPSSQPPSTLELLSKGWREITFILLDPWTILQTNRQIFAELAVLMSTSFPQHSCFSSSHPILLSLCLQTLEENDILQLENFSPYTNTTIKTCQWPVFTWTVCSPLTLKIKAIFIFRNQDFLLLQRLQPRHIWTLECLWWLWQTAHS